MKNKNLKIGIGLALLGALASALPLLFIYLFSPEILTNSPHIKALPFMLGCIITATLLYHPQYKYMGLFSTLMTGLSIRMVFNDFRSNFLIVAICLIFSLGSSILAAKFITYRIE